MPKVPDLILANLKEARENDWVYCYGISVPRHRYKIIPCTGWDRRLKKLCPGHVDICQTEPENEPRHALEARRMK